MRYTGLRENSTKIPERDKSKGFVEISESVSVDVNPERLGW